MGIMFSDNAPVEVVGPWARSGEKSWGAALLSQKHANDLWLRTKYGIAALLAFVVGAGLALLYAPAAGAAASSLLIFIAISFWQHLKAKTAADRLDLQLAAGWKEIPEPAPKAAEPEPPAKTLP